MMENDPGYYDRLNLLPEKDRKAKMEGDWFAMVGEVFTEFRSKKLDGEPVNAIHVIDNFEIPEWWPKIIAIDWGYTAHTACYWGAVSPDDRFFIYREYFQNKTSIANWAADISRLSQFDGNIKKIILDPSAWRNDGSELTIEQQFQKWSKFIPIKADNDRLGGKQLIHDFLRFEQKRKTYLPQTDFSQDLQIFKTCPHLIEAITLAQYDERNKEDVAEYSGDDSYDALRYLLKATDHFLREVTRENDIRRKIGIVEKDLASGQIDYTSFYQRMAFLDAKRSSAPKPVRRIH
jgi:hypothetical protein